MKEKQINLTKTHDVIVCVHNGHEDVYRCIDSVTKLWELNSLNNLHIIDDNSDEIMSLYLEEIKEKYNYVNVVHLNEQHFYTKAANIGLKESDAHIRTLLNSDTLVTGKWAEKIRTAMAIDDSIGIVGPLSNAASTQSLPYVQSKGKQTAINLLPDDVSIEQFAEYVTNKAVGRSTPFVPLVHGFCFTVKETVLNNIGVFDEHRFPRGYGEENDFCFRAENAGFLLAIALDAFVYHAKSKSYVSNQREQFMDAGMKALVSLHGVGRVKRSIATMEGNPHLQFMRNAVLKNWAHFYNDHSINE